LILKHIIINRLYYDLLRFINNLTIVYWLTFFDQPVFYLTNFVVLLVSAKNEIHRSVVFLSCANECGSVRSLSL